MGIALWLICALAAFVLSRLIPAGRNRRWLRELLTSLIVAALLGVGATALDFGGWREPDWRAGAFAFFGSFAAIGLIRVLTKPAPRQPEPPRQHG